MLAVERYVAYIQAKPPRWTLRHGDEMPAEAAQVSRVARTLAEVAVDVAGWGGRRLAGWKGMKVLQTISSYRGPRTRGK